jgi:phage-related minor tail protein
VAISEVSTIVSANIKPFVSGMRRVQQTLREISRRWREAGETMIDTGENLTEGLSLPFMTVGGAAFKAAGDIGAGMSIIQGYVGSSASEVTKWGEVAKSVWSSGLGEDINEVANAVGWAHTQFRNLSTVQIEGLVTDALALSQVMGEDVTSTLEEVKEITQEYGVTTEQAMDLVAAGYSAASLKGQNLAMRLQQVKGRADEVTAAANSSPWVELSGIWRQAQLELQPLGDLLLDIAERHLPTLVNWIKQAVSWFQSLSPTTQTFLLILSGLAIILPPILITIGALVMSVGALGTVFSALLSPITLIIAAIVAIAAAVIYAYNRFETFRDIVNNVMNVAKVIIQSAWNAIKAIFTGAVNIIMGILNTFKGLFTGNWSAMWNGVKQIIREALQIVWSVFKSLGLDKLTSGAKELGKKVWDAIKNAWDKVKDKTRDAWNSIANSVRNAANRVISSINSIISKLNSLFSFRMPSWLGGGSFSLNIPKIPRLASGGIVSSPTLAMIGEGRDSEAVLPLNNSTFDALASAIAQRLGGGGTTVNVYPKEATLDERKLVKTFRRATGWYL